MGVGGSLLGAAACGRNAIGINLNPTYIEAYKKAAIELGYLVFDTVEGDALEILADEVIMTRLLEDKEVSLVLIDPLYRNMMNLEKTGADIKRYGNVATPFTGDEKNLGNLELES